MAAGWLHGIYSFDQGWDHLIGDTEVEDLRERVEFVEDPAIEPISSARVELHFADGRHEDTDTISFPGSAENPMSDQQVEDAFRMVARGNLSDTRCNWRMAATCPSCSMRFQRPPTLDSCRLSLAKKEQSQFDNRAISARQTEQGYSKTAPRHS
jgi:hypothetical protein